MKKSLKSMLAVLLVAVMVFGTYVPLNGVTFVNLFSVEASAASVTSTTTGKFVIFLPAGVKMYSCSSVTGSTNSTPYFYSSSEQLTIYATEKCVLSNGNIRFLITANTASGVRTLYYQLPSSASAYQLPDPPDSISYSGKMCNDQYCKIEWDTDPYVDFYIVEVYDSNGELLELSHIYPPSGGKTEKSLDFSDRVTYGTGITETFSVSITPVREINNGWYYGNAGSYSSVKFGSCQMMGFSHGIYGINYDANGGYGGPSTQNWSNPCSGYTTLTSSIPSRSGYTFLGWSESRNASEPSYYPGSSVYFDHDQLFLYAVWSKIPTYTVYYNANGGSGAPSSQTKTKDTTLWLSSSKPSKSYTITYNANGGSVSPSSKTVSCTFKNWNTSQNGSGTSYSSGASYTANIGATLYAQWTNPTYGTLPTPTRTGYTFDGWYTSASGGTRIFSYSTVSSNTTLYAHWNKVEGNIYNLGEETYSFGNFPDTDSNGHCFGMSMTSSGYYIGELSVSEIGVSSSNKLYTVGLTNEVKKPIKYYQKIQGDYSREAIVAGGTNYKNSQQWDIDSDWEEVVSYVKNHNFDGKGSLQIGFRKSINGKTYGHAINFLRYEEVNGQHRIYAYDNNFPNTETYFYQDSNGNVIQAPYSTFSGSIDCIALRSVSKYFDLAEEYDSTRYIYAERDSISIEGVQTYLLDGSTQMGNTVMFEIPANVEQVTITPLVDNAEFEYLDESYSFGNVDNDTVGVFTLASSDDEGAVQSPSFTITNESKSFWDYIADFFMMILGIILLPFSFLF